MSDMCFNMIKYFKKIHPSNVRGVPL